MAHALDRLGWLQFGPADDPSSPWLERERMRRISESGVRRVLAGL